VRFAANRQIVYLSLCPASGKKPGCDMYQGATTTTADTYGSLNPMAGVNAPAAYDSYPTVSGDAQWVLFGSGRNGGVVIFRAAAVGSVFANPSPLAELNGLEASNEPYLLADGRTLYFGATVSIGSPQWDLYRTTGTVGSFLAPALVPGINGDATDEFAPVPTEDELELFFASSRAPGDTSNLDMWTSRRASITEAFGPAERLDALSGAQNEFPTSMSPDGCDLYYIRKTGSGDGVGTPYVTRRTPGR
jgi:Tol biopolymer transport system component